MSDKKNMHDIAVAVGLMVEDSTLVPDLEDLVLGAKSLRRRYEESKARIAELEGARAKAVDELKDEEERHQGTLGLLENADAGFLKQTAELADLREQCRGMEIRETSGNGIIIEQTAKIDEQARELERLRKFASQVSSACSPDVGSNIVRSRVISALVNLDRAATAQAEPQSARRPADREGGGR